MKNNIRISTLFSIKNKICIITGGCGGIGSELSKIISNNGGKVIVIDKNLPQKKQNKKIQYYKCDLSSVEDYKLLITKLRKKHKSIDCLINALGISDEKSFLNNVNINFISIYNFTKDIIEMMKKYGGSVINITSLNSELGFSNNPGYVSSKGALKMLTKSFCVDYAKYNIRFNNLGPGYIKTKMTKKNYSNLSKRNKRLNRIPLNRYGEPHEIFGAVAFLISDASSYVTGQDIYVDGGFLAKGI